MISITKFIKKVFVSQKSNNRISFKKLSHYLVKCAKSNSYIETLGKHSDSIHKWIKSSYEEDFKHLFELQVRKFIKKFRIKNAKIAFDITHEPFYGKTRNFHIFDNESYKKYNGEFHFITCCLINKGKEIPLMALPVRLGEQTKLTIDLIKYCISLFPNIQYALFDRGFYVAELIDFLESEKINYLILVPNKKGKIRNYISETENLGKFRHTMVYSKAKSKWRPKTQITICKNILEFDWIFATNIQLNQAKYYVLIYKKRWQIETNYRVEDEARIKSKSINYMIRYFYFLISLLLHIIWIYHKNISYYIQFKKFLDIIEYNIYHEILGLKNVKF